MSPFLLRAAAARALTLLFWGWALMLLADATDITPPIAATPSTGGKGQGAHVTTTALNGTTSSHQTLSDPDAPSHGLPLAVGTELQEPVSLCDSGKATGCVPDTVAKSGDAVAAEDSFVSDAAASHEGTYISLAAHGESGAFFDPFRLTELSVFTPHGPITCDFAVIIDASTLETRTVAFSPVGSEYALQGGSEEKTALPVITLQCGASQDGDPVSVEAVQESTRYVLLRDHAVSASANETELGNICFRRSLTASGDEDYSDENYRTFTALARIRSSKLFSALTVSDSAPLLTLTHRSHGVLRACVPATSDNSFKGKRLLSAVALRFLVQSGGAAFVQILMDAVVKMAATAGAKLPEGALTVTATGGDDDSGNSMSSLAFKWDFACAQVGSKGDISDTDFRRSYCVADGCSSNFKVPPVCLFGSSIVHALECEVARQLPVAYPTDCDERIVDLLVNATVEVDAKSRDYDTLRINFRILPVSPDQFAFTHPSISLSNLKLPPQSIASGLADTQYSKQGKWEWAPSASVLSSTPMNGKSDYHMSITTMVDPLAEHAIFVRVLKSQANSARLEVLSSERFVLNHMGKTIFSVSLETRPQVALYSVNDSITAVATTHETEDNDSDYVIVLEGDWGSQVECTFGARSASGMFPSNWLSRLSSTIRTPQSTIITASFVPWRSLIRCTGRLPPGGVSRGVLAIGRAKKGIRLFHELRNTQRALWPPAPQPLIVFRVLRTLPIEQVERTISSMIPQWFRDLLVSNITVVMDGGSSFAVVMHSRSPAAGMYLPPPLALESTLAKKSITCVVHDRRQPPKFGEAYAYHGLGAWRCFSASSINIGVSLEARKNNGATFEECAVPRDCGATFQGEKRCVVESEGINYHPSSANASISCLFAAPTRVAPQWSGCGTLMCRKSLSYNSSTPTYAPCHSESVCVHGCSPQVSLTPDVIAAAPELQPVCVRWGSAVDSNLCPKDVMKPPRYARTCRATSACCIDDQGKECGASLSVTLAPANDGSGSYVVRWFIPDMVDHDDAHVSLTLIAPSTRGGGLSFTLGTVPTPVSHLWFMPQAYRVHSGSYVATVFYPRTELAASSVLTKLRPGCAAGGEASCSNGGVCNTSSGVCTCAGEWTGPTCRVSPCDLKNCNPAASTCVVTSDNKAKCVCTATAPPGEVLVLDDLCNVPTVGCPFGLPMCANGGSLIPSQHDDDSCSKCTCMNNWTPSSRCHQCGLSCHRGHPDAQCSKCACAAETGFHGELCECRHLLATFLVKQTSLPFSLSTANEAERERLVSVFISSFAADMTAASEITRITPASVTTVTQRGSSSPFFALTFMVGSVCANASHTELAQAKTTNSEMKLLYSHIEKLQWKFRHTREHTYLPALGRASNTFGFRVHDPNCAAAEGCPADFVGLEIDDGFAETRSGDALPPGAIAGIAVGATVVVAASVAAVLWGMRTGDSSDL